MEEEKSIHILYTKISDVLLEDDYKNYLIFLPESLRAQHFRYRRWQDRRANLFSKILLIKGLQRFGYDYNILEQLKYDQYGRPNLTGDVDFNISHSGEYVLCGVGKGIQIGVDIEEIKPVDFSDFENLMTGDQWDTIHASADPQKSFFRLWAIKESIIKADGRGLAMPLKEIVITDQVAFYERKWYLKELAIDERYCAHLAYNIKNTLITKEYFDLGKM
jgi:4'-phosphopantetheinyl transferase